MHLKLALAILLASCAGTPTEDQPMVDSLADTSWRLVTIEGAPALPNADVTLTFQSDSITGSAGVNNYFGGWMVKDGELSISRLGATRMIGPDDAQQQEDRYLAILASVTAFECGDTRLVLMDGERPVLEFEPRS